MSSIASSSSASLVPTHLPAVSAAKAAGGSALGSAAGSPGASGDTTSTIVNADGSISIETTNARGQIVSISTSQATAGSGSLVDQLV